MNKILIVEDDKDFVLKLKTALEKEKFDIDIANKYNDALNKVKTKIYDLVLLDINLDESSGFNLYLKIKEMQDSNIIFLTARDSVEDNVYGLTLGADDYITKPFNTTILISKIKNILRKRHKELIINVSNLTLDLEKKKLFKLCEGKKEEIILTSLEYVLLEEIFKNKEKIITRDKLLDTIYDKTKNFVNDNTLTVYIKRIREKLGDKNIIQSVRGLGYRVVEE